MKHTSQLQQLHLLLTSEQPGAADSHGCGLKETNKTFSSLDLDDSCSPGASSERDLPNSGRQPSRSQSDSATSRDLSPDRSDVYMCSGSGGSARSDFSSVSLHDVPSHYIFFSPSYKLTNTPIQPSDTHGGSVDALRLVNNVTNDSSSVKTAANSNASVMNYSQKSMDELDHEYTSRECFHGGIFTTAKHDPTFDHEYISRECFHGGNPSAAKLNLRLDHEYTSRECFHGGNPTTAKHDPREEWAMNDLLSDVARNVGTCDSLECQTIGDLQACNSETPQTSDGPKLKPLLPDSQSLQARNRRQRQMEIQQVHQVYKQIAPHCDHVRQKAWPRVKQFLKELDPGSLVADVGCGNGRYLMINSSTFKLGCDLCPPFLEQARSQGHEVMIADNIALPYRDGTFDAVISIGVIHHFASLERRIKAISELSRILSPGGKLMVYVWAFEQVHRKFESQDVLIPWVKPEVKGNAPRKILSVSSEPEIEWHRSRSGFHRLDELGVSTSGRRQRPDCSKRPGSVGEKYRSKSLGDEDPTRYVCRDLSGVGDYFQSQALGEFDQRVGRKRECKIATDDSVQVKSAVSVHKSNHDCPKREEAEDFKKVSKWPEQLVSECRKLGKFLHSLSSRSNSLGDGEVDQTDLMENVPDVYRNFQHSCNTNPHTDMVTENAKDIFHSSRWQTQPAENYDTQNNSTVNVKQFDQRKSSQDNYNRFDDRNTMMTRSWSARCNDVSIPADVSSGSCQVYSTNTVTTSPDVIACHNTPANPSGTKHTPDSGLVSTLLVNNTSSISSVGTNCPLSHEDRRLEGIANENVGEESTLIRNSCLHENKVDNICNNQALGEESTLIRNSCLGENKVDNIFNNCALGDNYTLMRNICSDENKVDNIWNNHAPGEESTLIRNSCLDEIKVDNIWNNHVLCDKSTLIRNSCLDEIKVDNIWNNRSLGEDSTLIRNSYLHENKVDNICNNRAPSLRDTDIEPSDSWMTMSRSDSFTSGASASSQSDRTIMDTQFGNKSKIPARCSENLYGLSVTQGASLSCGETPKGLPGSLLESAPCVLKGVIYEDVCIHEMNRCLPKCQNISHTMAAQSGNLGHKQLVEETNNPAPSRSDASAEVSEELSETTGCADHLHSRVSLVRGQYADSSTGHYNIRTGMPESRPTKYSQGSLDNESRNEGEMEIHVDKTKESAVERDKIMIQATRQVTNNEETQNLPDSALSQNVVPFRGTFKSFLHKLSSYFRVQSKHGSNSFDYHNGNSAARMFMLESDSSDVETSVSSFSTHSSCYPGLFAGSRQRDNDEKRDNITETDPHKPDTEIYDDSFEIINDIQTPVDSNTNNTGKVIDKFKLLSIGVFNDKQNFRQDFVNDVSEAVVEDTKDKAKNITDDPYVFKVENISLVPVRKASFLNTLSQKWSGLFGKRSGADFRKPCLNYSTACMSSSDDNEERLTISLKDMEASHMSGNPPQNRMLTRRPNSLDFSQKRTRRRGRRPAPRKEHTETVTRNNKGGAVQNSFRQVQENVQLSLTDAMTLLGDGVDEEFIIKRLDNSAKTIFAEMKRINFAMRQFPMSSLANRGNEDIAKEKINTENMSDGMTNIKHRTLKMRRDKKIFSSHFRFSELSASQDGLKSRRHFYHGHKGIDGINNMAHGPCLDIQCVSEDLGISLDELGAKLSKSKFQVLYSCNSDSKEDLFALLHSSSENENGPVRLQNWTNNARVVSEDSVSSGTPGDFQQGASSTTSFAENSLDFVTMDTDNNRSSKYDPESDPHAAGCAAVRKYSTPQQCTDGIESGVEVAGATNDLSKDGSSVMENNATIINSKTPCSLAGVKPPLRALSHILKSRPMGQSSETRTLDNTQATESKTDNSLSRYYHVFKKGELDHLVTRYVPSLRIVDTFYDHANWCIIAEKLTVP